MTTRTRHLTTTKRAPRRRARRGQGRAADDALSRLRRFVAKNGTTSKRDWTNGLRELAAQAFVSDREQRSVAWHARQLADLVSTKTVESWSAKDRWVERRAQFIVEVREAVLREIGASQASQFIDDLRQLDAIYVALAGALLRDDGAVPATFTSRAEAIRCLLTIDQRRDEKRQLLDAARPAALPTREVAPPVLALPAHVARAMAHARLRAEHAGGAESPSG